MLVAHGNATKGTERHGEPSIEAAGNRDWVLWFVEVFSCAKQCCHALKFGLHFADDFATATAAAAQWFIPLRSCCLHGRFLQVLDGRNHSDRGLDSRH